MSGAAWLKDGPPCWVVVHPIYGRATIPAGTREGALYGAALAWGMNPATLNLAELARNCTMLPPVEWKR